MPAPTLITDLSTTAASNSPAGSETPSVLDDVQRAHAAFIAQLRDNKVSWGGTAGGTANAFTLTPSPASTSYVTGQAYQFIAVGTNTGAATVNVSALGAKAVQYEGAALTGSEILSGKMYSIRYDGTQFQLERTSMLRDRKGADIASAATVDLGTATGNSVDVTHSTGTTAITSLGGASLQAGTPIETRFVITGGTLTLTHHATNLYLAGGANITLANGDVIRWRKMHSSNAEWKMVGGVKADGTAWVVAAASGKIVQVVEGTPYTTYSSTATAMPADDSIPQNTEGAEWITASITSTSATNRLRIEATMGMVSGSGAIDLVAGLFQDSTANALTANVISSTGNFYVYPLSLSHEMAAGTTSSTTFKLRAGPASGTMYVNGKSSTRMLGGVSAVRLRITEIKV